MVNLKIPKSNQTIFTSHIFLYFSVSELPGWTSKYQLMLKIYVSCCEYPNQFLFHLHVLGIVNSSLTKGSLHNNVVMPFLKPAEHLFKETLDINSIKLFTYVVKMF